MAEAVPLRQVETGFGQFTEAPEAGPLVLMVLTPKAGTERTYSMSPHLARALAHRLLQSAEDAEVR